MEIPNAASSSHIDPVWNVAQLWITQVRCGITNIIYKTGLSEDVSSYYTIIVTNTDGEIYLSILAKRALSFMVSKGYFDINV